MSLDTNEIDGYDDHACGASGCTVCVIFKRSGESEDDWQARIRSLWNAPEAIPTFGPKPFPMPEPVPRPERTHCDNGLHTWTRENTQPTGVGDYLRCRPCRQAATQRSSERRRSVRQRQEAIA